jgi:hypothetical protein
MLFRTSINEYTILDTLSREAANIFSVNYMPLVYQNLMIPYDNYVSTGFSSLKIAGGIDTGLKVSYRKMSQYIYGFLKSMQGINSKVLQHLMELDFELEAVNSYKQWFRLFMLDMQRVAKRNNKYVTDLSNAINRFRMNKDVYDDDIEETSALYYNVLTFEALDNAYGSLIGNTEDKDKNLKFISLSSIIPMRVPVQEWREMFTMSEALAQLAYSQAMPKDDLELSLLSGFIKKPDETSWEKYARKNIQFKPAIGKYPEWQKMAARGLSYLKNRT